MKKKGFTLAEVLIAVGIIGVMSAIMASAFNQAKPDKTKMMYLKAYDSLSEAVSIMANDSTLFSTSIHVGPDPNDDINVNIEIAPLFDSAQPTNPYYYNNPNLHGPSKFGRILALMFKVNNPTVNDNVVSFTTGPSEMTWTVNPMELPQFTTTTQEVGACSEVTLSIEGNEFGFCVQPDGSIRVLDQVGATYLANRKNVRSRNDVQAPAPNTQCTATTYYIVDGILTDEQPPANP